MIKDLTDFVKELLPLIAAITGLVTVVVTAINTMRTNAVSKKVDAVAVEQAVAAEKVIEVKDALVVAGEKRDHQLETVVAKVEEVKAAVDDNTVKTERLAESLPPPRGD